MSLAYDVANLVLGIVGAAGVLQTVYSFISYNLPSHRLKVFDENYHETTALFRAVVEERLILQHELVQDLEARLLGARSIVEEYRAKVHRASSFMQQCQGWGNGLSTKIDLKTEEIAQIRMEISTTSDRERKRLRSKGVVVNAPLVSAASRNTVSRTEPAPRPLVAAPTSPEPHFTATNLMQLVHSSQASASSGPQAGPSVVPTPPAAHQVAQTARPRAQDAPVPGVSVSGVEVGDHVGLTSRGVRQSAPTSANNVAPRAGPQPQALRERSRSPSATLFRTTFNSMNDSAIFLNEASQTRRDLAAVRKVKKPAEQPTASGSNLPSLPSVPQAPPSDEAFPTADEERSSASAGSSSKGKGKALTPA